ncbi:MAG: radical SAM protein [Sphaerochaeta sp.]|jgi:putative pyruvate formate lyase activating enzyme|uniref:radical SAM protein n=1 Tax=Sphaerochaeta sp. TaxID=1972642 RepID=UPI003D0F1815
MDEQLLQAYTSCRLCPNYCHVDRLSGKRGICGENATVRVAWAGLHKGEEPPVSGTHGSGMIFFSGCPLHCAYCQNHQISGKSETGSDAVGIELHIDELVRIMLGLQEMGATNLNLVTGTHFIPSIIAALHIAREQDLVLDVVWNSSGFESPEGLSLIDPYVDLYLVDVKTLDLQVSAEFCAQTLYAKKIQAVMDFLVDRHPRTYEDAKGNLKGLLVRHLVFPNSLKASLEVLRYFAGTLKEHAYLSLMVQFEPPKQNVLFPPITQYEYDLLLQTLEDLDIEDGFVQELGENVSWIPDFTQENPFPEDFAVPLPLFQQIMRSRNR